MARERNPLMREDIGGMTTRDGLRDDGFASSEPGRSVIGEWQDGPGSMDIRPVPPVDPSQRWQQPAQTQARTPRQAQGSQQWRQAVPLGHPAASMTPMQPTQRGQSPAYLPGAQAASQWQGGSWSQGQASYPAWQQAGRRRKSKAPVILGLVLAVVACVAIALFASNPDDPRHDVSDWRSDSPGASDEGELGKQTTDGSTDQDASLGSPVADAFPEPEGFLWSYAPWIKEGHIPERATRLTELSDVMGGWKGTVRYPATDSTEAIDAFLNVAIEGDGTSTTLRFDWGYEIVGEARGRREDDSPDSTFLGTWDGDNGAIYATEPAGNLEMKRFWYEDGAQYAYGTLTLPDGTLGDVYLMRS